MFLCWSCRFEDHHKLPPLWEASLGPPLRKTCPNPAASATNHPTHACLGRLKTEGLVDHVPIAKAGWGPDTVRQSQSSPKAWPGTNCGAWWPWWCTRKQVPQKHHKITTKKIFTTWLTAAELVSILSAFSLTNLVSASFFLPWTHQCSVALMSACAFHWFLLLLVLQLLPLLLA